MDEKVTFIFMFGMILLSAIVTTFLIKKRDESCTKVKLCFVLHFVFVFQLGFVNLVRCALLLGKRNISYNEEPFIFLIDLAAILMGIWIQNYYFSFEKVKSIKWVPYNVILCACWWSGVLSSVWHQMKELKNMKSALYECLLPQVQVLICIGSLIILGSIYFLKNRKYKNRKVFWENFKQEIFLKLMSMVCFIVVTIVYPFTETYLANREEFSFAYSEIIPFALIYVMLVLLLLGILFFMVGRKYLPLIYTLFTVSVGAYIQEMFLNDRMFLMDGNRLQWSMPLKMFDLFVWMVVFFIVGILLKYKKKTMKAVMTFIAFLLVSMQCVGIISLSISTPQYKKEQVYTKEYFSTEGLNTVAKKNNVIVFVLDTYDVDYLNAIIQETPDFLSPLTGFTYFPDTVSQYSRTFPSIPYMLSGREYFYEIPQSEYNQQAVPSCELWNQFLKNDYALYFFEESQEFIGDDIRFQTENYAREGQEIKKIISGQGVIESFYRINMYRLMPYFIKNNYIYNEKMINALVTKEEILEKPKFSSSNTRVYREFKEYGLTTDDEKNAFRFIHLDGAHAPYVMDRKGNEVDEDCSSLLEQCRGVMQYVFEYINELKRLNLYEQSMIIITADHGENYVTKELEQNTNPILFIKPQNSNQEEPLKVSDVYASQNDIIATISAEVGFSSEETYGLNLFLTNGEDKTRTRYHYYTVVENSEQTMNRTYQIEGSSLDFNDWIPTQEYRKFIYY